MRTHVTPGFLKIFLHTWHQKITSDDWLERDHPVWRLRRWADDGPALTPDERTRERHLNALVLGELRRAAAVKLGVDLPHDKRLRHLCEAVLADPTRHATLSAWAQDTGASPRTVARLFRTELSSTFTQWRQQVILAKAVSLAAGRMPMGQIAAELGYSASAFSAMVRKSVGQPPGRFLGAAR